MQSVLFAGSCGSQSRRLLRNQSRQWKSELKLQRTSSGRLPKGGTELNRSSPLSWQLLRWLHGLQVRFCPECGIIDAHSVRLGRNIETCYHPGVHRSECLRALYSGGLRVVKTVDSTSDISSAPLPHGVPAARGQGLVPQLLVSARSAVECLEAIRGGAEILDLKEPSLGALGRVTAEQLARCLSVLEAQSTGISISLAMGELLDWSNQLTPAQVAFLEIIRAHKHRIRFLKFGLSGCDEFSLKAEWTNRLSSLRRFLADPFEVDEIRAGIKWQSHFCPSRTTVRGDAD